jgi:predicted nucleotidyltransferase
MSNTVSPELIRLAGILADWAAPAPDVQIYVYGSRVRGDHRIDSDVDINVVWKYPAAADVLWWSANNDENFATINAKLGFRLEILEGNDALQRKISSARIVYEVRNIRCVWLPPEP